MKVINVGVALVFFLLIILIAQTCSANSTFCGIGIFGGEQWEASPIWHTSKDYSWQEFQIRPIVGKHVTDKWDLWLEGNLGYIHWKNSPDSIKLGVNIMTSYDVLQYKNWSLSGELGVGVGWMNYTPSTNLVRNNVLGFIDYGIGIKTKIKQGLIFKIGPRFHHSSAMLARDSGINSYGLMTTIAW